MSATFFLGLGVGLLCGGILFFMGGMKVYHFYDERIEHVWKGRPPYQALDSTGRENLVERYERLGDFAFAGGFLAMLGVPLGLLLLMVCAVSSLLT